MSIPPTSEFRGCASNFAQPVGEEDIRAAQNLVNNVRRVNVDEGPLNEIVYRPGDLEFDIRHPLVRWDQRSYEDIFQNGLQARPQGNTPNGTYYNLDRYIHNAGAALDPNRRETYAFVSTTLNYAWHPIPNRNTLSPGDVIEIYRYEIYAPGGIWVAVTLRGHYNYNSQAEVCFVGGIAPQYIRSCLKYTFVRDPGSGRFISFYNDDQLIINRYFNPQAYPFSEVIISLPTHTFVDKKDGKEKYLSEVVYPAIREKREVSNDNSDDALEWYTHNVVEVSSYINAAFRSSRTNEAYLFMKNKYVLMNYAPGTKDDRIVNGPHLICDSFLSLIDTPFGEQGIDCAFDADYNTGFPFYRSKTEAFIFCGNLCAHIDYAPGTKDDKILSGPMTIAAMFPFFKGTAFENGIDAAFTSTRSYEAYLFKSDEYALIDYDAKNVIAIRKITDGFPSLLGTVFANDIDAAFASHREDEAYLFKGELYALINFAPGTTDDYIVGSRIKRILPNWPSLSKDLPLKNEGLNFHDHHGQEGEHDPDQHDAF